MNKGIIKGRGERSRMKEDTLSYVKCCSHMTMLNDKAADIIIEVVVVIVE